MIGDSKAEPRARKEHLNGHRSYLVTGAAGFIGSHLCEALVGTGHKVVGVDNFDPLYDRAIKERNLCALLREPRFELARVDIRDRGALAECFEQFQPDAVVHLAARAGVRGSVADPLLYNDINVQGTVTLLECAVKSGVERFVFGSSSSVYGAANSVPFHEEQSVSMPVSPYAASKVAGEAYCYAYHDLYGLPVVCLRFFTVYGPRQRPDLAISKFARLMLAGEPVPLYGDGSISRDFTYVGDIVRGITAALKRPELGDPGTYEIINLGSDSPVTVMELVLALEGALGIEAQIDWQPISPGDVPRTWADTSRAQRLLDWTAQVGLSEGLKAFVAWRREQPSDQAASVAVAASVAPHG